MELDTKDKVRKFADEGGHNTLNNCINLYDSGDKTWCEAMQLAAVMLAAECKELHNMVLAQLDEKLFPNGKIDFDR